MRITCRNLSHSIHHAILLAGIYLSTTAPAAADPIDFDRDIRPILARSCHSCHGPEKHKGDLRLDARPLAFKGGVSGNTIIPGDSEQSVLVRRLRGLDDEDQMPLKADPLPQEQIDLIAAWIDQGAVWPETAADAGVVVKQHWAFVKPERPAEPTVHAKGWVRTPIDRFILNRLEHEGIKPSPEASKETLLRRVHLDLTGLPPSPAQIDDFLADSSPDAYENVVDRLLASPHYGERWGRHWLDAARYADSNGYSIDSPRSVWKYRDWVINALNRDMPLDQFTIEQIAGDMLPSATLEQKIATGFHRNTQINEEGGIDPEQFRIEAIIDRVNTTASVFLGLTVACAQCHNHKFDPISQREYYQLFAFFNNADEPKLKILTPDEERHNAALRAKISALEMELAARDPDEQAAKGVNKKELDALRKQQAQGVTTLVMAERSRPRKTHIFIKGDFTRPGEPVSPGVPRVLHPLAAEKPDRLDLARWLVDPANPLTARVIVNRFWQHYFGKGLVETESDFGTQGTPPTHPELLDRLAIEFQQRRWNMKAMHRLIVTSAVYRQSSDARPDLQSIDPYNKLLARQSRLRLDAEIIRDVSLIASGLLHDRVGGPSVFPPQPDGVMTLGQVRRTWKADTGPDRYRRGMYTFFWRATPHPLLLSFDAPDATSTCTRRIRSNTPLQSLTLLNDQAFVEFARALAARVLREANASDPQRIARAFRLCTGRPPAADEAELLHTLLETQRQAFENAPDEAKALAAADLPEGVSAPEFAAWSIVARVLLNLDETITRE